MSIELTEQEREALERSVAATINYHSFDAAAETADYDMAAAIMDTNLSASSAGLAATVEQIIAARLSEVTADLTIHLMKLHELEREIARLRDTLALVRAELERARARLAQIAQAIQAARPRHLTRDYTAVDQAYDDAARIARQAAPE